MPAAEDPIVVCSATRTPLGSFQGSLAHEPAPRLGGHAVRAAIDRAGLAPADLDSVLLGQVLTAGVGQAPARQAVLSAGMPEATDATLINKVCGSAMKAVMLGAAQLRAGESELLVAGGMESMSRAPYLLDGARSGYRLGHKSVSDHMLLDGLEDSIAGGTHMGRLAERCAEHFAFSREAQDAFALESMTRARAAVAGHAFDDEIVGVTTRDTKGEVLIRKDETPMRLDPNKIHSLKPAFLRGGTITAASASALSDGAAAVVLARESTARARGLPILARLVAHASQSQDTPWYTTAPVGAIRSLLARTGWRADDVGLYEINEAFAVVPMAAMHILGLPHSHVNIHGGACALGHPIGASGVRILVTLLHALRQQDLPRGIATLCIGGGEATALAIERPG